MTSFNALGLWQYLLLGGGLLATAAIVGYLVYIARSALSRIAVAERTEGARVEG